MVSRFVTLLRANNLWKIVFTANDCAFSGLFNNSFMYLIFIHCLFQSPLIYSIILRKM